MLVYLMKTRQFFATNRPISQRAIAAESDVHEDVVSRWHKVPGFDDWMRDELFGEARRVYPLALVAAARRVVRTGDPAELEKLARLLGELPSGMPDPEAPPANTPTFQLNILVPRPEMPMPAGAVVVR